MSLISGLFQTMEPMAILIDELPYSAIVIVIISIIVSIISAWTTRRFTNVEQMKSDMAELKAWQQKLMLARKTKDPILLQEVTDDQSRILTIQARVTSSRMKPMCIFYIPLILIWYAMGALYGAHPVVILPFNIQKVLPFVEGWIGTSVGVTGGF